MIRYLVLSLLVAAAYGEPNKLESTEDSIAGFRIYKGTQTTIINTAYQVSILFKNKGTFTQICGGSIIRDDVILSAAHCVNSTNPDMWRVHAASTSSHSGGQFMDVRKILIHDQFDEDTLDYDISLYFLSANIKLGKAAAIVNLPAQGESVDDGTIAVVSGWGLTKEGGKTVEFLQKFDVLIINQQECVTAYEEINSITDRMLCAGVSEAVACTGDSGGPLVFNKTLYGIISFGPDICGDNSIPGVYVRVSAFVDWIKQNSEIPSHEEL